jgi:hypothetical protein
VVQADGRILVGGTFGGISGQTRSCLAGSIDDWRQIRSTERP